MASGTFREVESFISKFCQLSSYGYKANVNFSSENGKVCVNFMAELGDALPTQPYTVNRPRQEKPSRIKRRQRRKNANLHNEQEAHKASTSFVSEAIDPTLNASPTTSQICVPEPELPILLNELSNKLDDEYSACATSSSEFCNTDVSTVAVQSPELPSPLPNVGQFQAPISCIRQEDGCKNMIYSYYNKYTAICDSCAAFLEDKLKKTPFPHNLCPCCHQESDGPPLSLCAECHDDIMDGGWTKSGWSSWHLDVMKRKIVCISLDFAPRRVL